MAETALPGVGACTALFDTTGHGIGNAQMQAGRRNDSDAPPQSNAISDQRKRRRRHRNDKLLHLDGLVTSAISASSLADVKKRSTRLDMRSPIGRPIYAVLSDVKRLLIHLREKKDEHSMSAREESAAAVQTGQGDTARTCPMLNIRDGLLACDTLMFIEVEAISCRIASLGRGAQRFFENAPWGDCTGMTLTHFVHSGDVPAFLD